MASETESAVKGYLRQVLADGARLFRYRSRVRALLGLPESGGVQMNFAKPLPVAGFAYIRPQFSDEFDVSDEFPAASPHRAAYTEEAVLLMPRGVSVPDERERASNRRISNQPAAPSGGPRTGQPSEMTVQRQDIVVPGSALPRSEIPPSGEIGPQERNDVGSQAMPTQPQSGGERPGPTLRGNDVIIPDVRRQHLAAASGETRAREIASTRSQESGRTHPPSRVAQPQPQVTGGPPPPSFADSPPARASDTLPPPHRAVGGTASHQTVQASSHAPAVEKLHSSSGRPRSTPQTMPRELRVVATPNEAALPQKPFEAESWPVPSRAESAVSHRTSELLGHDAIARTRSVPSVRWPDGLPSERSTQRRSEARQRPSEDDVSSRASAASAPQSPVIVLNQPPGPGMTPCAFWERRHLSHLRVRIRR